MREVEFLIEALLEMLWSDADPEQAVNVKGIPAHPHSDSGGELQN